MRLGKRERDWERKVEGREEREGKGGEGEGVRLGKREDREK